MRSISILRWGFFWLIASALPFRAPAQNAQQISAIPHDPLELAKGQIQTADLAARREPVFQLLNRARNMYALRKFSQPWGLKVHFTVNSLGQTNFDGDWEMEDIFSPGQGLHWTAHSAAGYRISGIFGTNETYAEATADTIPLRLQEARAMLYNPLPSVAYANTGAIRTVTATLGGSPVVCLLLARSRTAPNPPDQRGWDESEDCIDPQTGLLRMHSEAPGRYAVFDYTNAVRLGNHTLPRTVTVMEGGRAVSTISVTSFQALTSVDPALFVPTDAMKANGPAVVMSAATKIARIQGASSLTPVATLKPVCVFGLVNPAGRLVEAHSLQPSDPNSEAALKDAESIDFSPSTRPGSPRQQHFVFVIEKFVSAQ